MAQRIEIELPPAQEEALRASFGAANPDIAKSFQLKRLYNHVPVLVAGLVMVLLIVIAVLSVQGGACATLASRACSAGALRTGQKAAITSRVSEAACWCDGVTPIAS